MASTTTREDIVNHVIEPACAQWFDTRTLEAIADAVLDVAPLRTWRLVDLEYQSEDMDEGTFWAIVERVGERDI